MTEIDKKPLATLIVLTYLHEDFVREALMGALAQTYEPLEIIVSDDASSDGTWQIINSVASAYKGKHRITVRQNPVNLGINKHFNEVMSLVNGEYVIISAGDDISEPDRVSVSIEVLNKQGGYGLFSNGMKIDEQGNEMGLFMPVRYAEKSWMNMIASGSNGGSGFSLAWRKSVMHLFPSIPNEPLGEDAFIPFRCALFGRFLYVDKALVRYRVHGANSSFWSQYSGTSSTESRLVLARKEIQHFTQIQKQRLEDIKQAERQGIISSKDVDRARLIIGDYLSIEQKKFELLEKRFLQFTKNLIKNKRCFISNERKFPALHFWYKSLRYYFPRTYSLVKSLVGKVRNARAAFQ